MQAITIYSFQYTTGGVPYPPVLSTDLSYIEALERQWMKGHGFSINKGIQAARDEYIDVGNDDDYLISTHELEIDINLSIGVGKYYDPIHSDTDEAITENDEEYRICTVCKKKMRSGYVINGGEEYYCSDECLHRRYSPDQWDELYDNGNSDSYWTEWKEGKLPEIEVTKKPSNGENKRYHDNTPLLGNKI